MSEVDDHTRHDAASRVRRLVAEAVVFVLSAVAIMAVQPPLAVRAAALPAPANAIVECDSSGTWSTDPVLGPIVAPDGTVTVGAVFDPTCDALRRLEDAAVTQVMTLRGLSGGRDLARVAARDEITALLWLGVEQAIRTPVAQRTADQTLIVTWMENVWRRHVQVAAAGASAEWRKFDRRLSDGRPGACTYTPPEPYQAEYPGGGDGDGVRWAGCFQRKGSLGSLFTGDGPRVPHLEDWVKWGSVGANDELVAGFPQMIKLSSAAIGLISGVSAGVVAGGGLLFAGTGAKNSTRRDVYLKLTPSAKTKAGMANLEVKVPDPNVNVTRDLDPKGVKAITRTTRVVRAATAFLRAMPLLDIIITAIDIAVTRAIELFVVNNPAADVGAQIAQLQVDAARTPDLNALLDDSARAAALVQLFASGLTGTMGDPAPPLPTVDDPQFRVTSSTGQVAPPTPTVQVLDWAGKPMTVQLIAGYFVATSASGEVTTTTQLTLLDGMGRPVTASLLREGDVYHWVLTPNDTFDQDCITATDIECPVLPFAAFRTTPTDGAFFEVTVEQTAGMDVTGPRTAVQFVGAGYSVSATDGGGNPIALTDVRWEARRQLRPEVDWAGRSTDPCSPGTGGTPSPLAATTECVESGTGTSFDPVFASWGTWRLTVTGRSPDGLLLRRVIDVDVANAQPAVLGFPCPGPDVFGVSCSVTSAPEGSEIVLRGLVVDGASESITLEASVNGTVVGSAGLPCTTTGVTPLVSDSAGIVTVVTTTLIGFGRSLGPCADGLEVTELTDDAGRANGQFLVEWRIVRDEPLEGTVALTARNVEPGVESFASSLGTGGWTNVSPVARVPIFSPFPDPDVPRNTTISFSGIVEDQGTPSMTAVSATMNGLPADLPTLTARMACPPNVFGPACQRPTGVFDFSWSGVAPRSRTGAVEPLHVVLTFADAQGGTTTVTKSYSLAAIDDRTPPTYTINDVPEGGWYGPTAPPVIAAVDDESDISAADGCGVGGNPIDGRTGTITISCTATSRGGTSTGTFSVAVDHTPPTFVTSGSFIVDGGVYEVGDVPGTGSCVAEDAHAGMGTGGCVVTGFSGEPGAHTLVFTATDRVGNQATLTKSYTVEGTAPFRPILTRAEVSGREGASGWYLGDVSVSFPTLVAAPGVTILGVTGCEPVTLSTDGSLITTCQATYVFDGLTRTFDIGPFLRRDTVAPTIVVNGGPQAGATYLLGQVPSINLTPLGPSLDTCIASDATSGVRSPYCSINGYSTDRGSHVLRYTSTDRAGNVRNIEVPYTVIDDTAPGMTFGTIPGDLVGDIATGWFHAPEEVYFEVFDFESPITGTVGCGRVVLDRETTAAGRTFTCTATSEGGTTTETMTWRLDMTPPGVVVGGGPDANAVYAPGEVPGAPTCTATDALSGPAGCEVDGYSTEPGAHTITFTARDVAGNVSTRTRAYRVTAAPDATPPIVAPSATVESPLVDGWARGDLTLSWNVFDDGSLVSSTSGCASTVVSTDTGPDGVTFTCSATSSGGTTTESVTILRDATGPVIEVLGGPAAGQSYLPGAVPPAPICRVTDAGAGVLATSACTVAGHGTAVGDHTMTFTAVDLVGNSSTRAVSYTVLADATPPTVTGTATGTPGANGWFTDEVTVTFDVSDPESAVLLRFDCDPLTVTEDTAGTDITCEAVSLGGSTSRTVTVQLDSVAPEVALVGGPTGGRTYRPIDVPEAPTCEFSDAGSGVEQECVITGYSTELGTHTVTGTVTDVAGNVATEQVTYTVSSTGPTPPAAPTAVAVAAVRPGTVSVSFVPPTNDGGSPIASFRAVCSSTTGGTARSASAASSPIQVSGLDGGASYRCRVNATNEAGTGPGSAPSAEFVAGGTPGAPTAVVATETGAGRLSVAFTAPASDGGSPVTGYVALCTSPTGTSRRVTGVSSPIAVSSLTGGAEYTCLVHAVNADGTGVASVPSNPVTVRTAPGIPTDVVALPSGARRASVSFVAPVSDGGSPITSYRVVCATPGGTSRSAAGASSPLTITSLVVGAEYTCRASATNTIGTSTASAPSTAFVAVDAPGAPTAVVATETGAGRLSVAFTAPASDGGSPVTGYVALCTSPTGTSRRVTGVSSPIAVSSLTGGADYTCVVYAINAVGTSAASTASAAVAVRTAPGVPTIASATRLPTNATRASVSFVAPVSDGGSPITSYRVVCATPGGASRSAAGASSPLTITSLVVGAECTCRASATNTIGTGTASAAVAIADPG